MERRDFLNLLISSSIVFANSCKRKSKFFLPKIKEIASPERNNKLHFATTFPHRLFPLGIIVETYEDKPYSIQRNENHLHNNSSLPLYVFPSLYNLYDPFRFFNPRIENKEMDINDALEILLRSINKSIKDKKEIIFVIQDFLSPTLFKLISEIKSIYSDFYFYAIPNVDLLSNQIVANQILFNSRDFLLPDLTDAEIVLNIGSDFMSSDYFASFYLSKLCSKKYTLITIENVPSLTGMNSNFRFVLQEKEYLDCLLSLLIEISNFKNLSWLHKCLCKINSHIGFSHISRNIFEIIKLNKKVKVIIDPFLHPIMHTLGYILEYLINGESILNRWVVPFSKSTDYYSNSFLDFQTKLSENNFDTLVLFDSNPKEWIYNGINDVIANISKNNCFVFSFYPNYFYQVGYNCIPIKHYLEYWGDYLNIDKSISIQQPIVYPLNKNSLSLNELLISILENLKNETTYKTFFDYFKSYYINHFSSDNEFFSSISNGIISLPNMKDRPDSFSLNNSKITKVLTLLESSLISEKHQQNNGNEILLSARLSCKFFDGSYSNNPYLLELPDPIFGISWNDFLVLNEKIANKLEISDNDIVLVVNENTGKRIELPIIVSNLVSLDTGFFYIGNGTFYHNSYKTNSVTNKLEVVEFNYQILNFEDKSFYYLDSSTIVSIEKSGKELVLSRLKSSSIISSVSQLSELLFTYEDKSRSMYALNPYVDKWKLFVEIDRCIGCNLCLLACQLENNIPLVGEKEIQKQRDLYWIRIEKFKSENGYKQFYFLPIMCQQCDFAPCEAVCPVGATSHSEDGINEMTYNRCIGSRICMINCPYKVRRFNFDKYERLLTNSISEFKNPDVTVRSIGVSEKCNFCIHRLRDYQRNEKNFMTNERYFPSTACQDVCPSKAIVLIKGDVKIKNSTYKILLGNFNTRPNVLYNFTSNEKSK